MRSKVYFVSDVHLGLRVSDPQEREDRFVEFLHGINNGDTLALYLLGDIWDFWYEYRDVIPRVGFKVTAALSSLVDAGVEVYFFPGNHDIWCFSFFESIGMHKCVQPGFVEIGGKTFCLGHGDGLGGSKLSYRLLQGVFRSKVAQALFSTLHPWLAYRFGLGWSGGNRRRHKPYHFRGEGELLYAFARETLGQRHVDYFVFGHFHDLADLTMEGGSRLVVLDDWMDGGSPYACFDAETATFGLNS